MSAQKLTVELHADKTSASFNVDGKQIELDEKNRTYTAKDEHTYNGLLQLPFLKPAAEKGAK
jgi:hypothetical protein